MEVESTRRTPSARNIWNGDATLTPLAIAALGILILRRPSLMRSWVTTVWPPSHGMGDEKRVGDRSEF